MDQHMNVPGADISTASDRVTTQDTCTRVCCHLWPQYSLPQQLRPHVSAE